MSADWIWYGAEDRERARRIEADVGFLKQKVTKMALNIDALTAAVQAEEVAEQAAAAAILEIVKELQDLRNQAGGALQPQIDQLTQRLQAAATSLQASTDAATAAEQPAS